MHDGNVIIGTHCLVRLISGFLQKFQNMTKKEENDLANVFFVSFQVDKVWDFNLSGSFLIYFF